jgi:hypothetical protein
MTKHMLSLTTFILLSLVSNGQTNVYHPFPDSNAHWSEYAGWLVGGGPCYVDDFYTLFLLGDTVVQTKTYHKIYQSGFISSNCPPPGYYYYNQYKGAMRQDIAMKKVYFLPPSSFNDTLLYDFNLNVGDTLPLTYFNNTTYIVTSIDSVLVGTNYHKQFNMDNLSYPLYAIIEGVGSLFGLYNPFAEPFESSSQLSCFSNNDQYYPSNSNCTFALGIADTNYEILSTSIFPNPFTSQTTLQIDKSLANSSLTLYNSLGQQVKQVNNISGQTVTLHRDNLPSGLYYLQLTQDNKTIATDKLVIAD